MQNLQGSKHQESGGRLVRYSGGQKCRGHFQRAEETSINLEFYMQKNALQKQAFEAERSFNNSLAAQFLMCDDSRRKLRFTEEMKDTRRVSLWIKRKGCFWFLYTLMYLYLFIAKTLTVQSL